jgi:hypothetical protein
LYVPNFGKASDARILADMAFEAERSGWDGFFLWDHIALSTCPNFALDIIYISTELVECCRTAYREESP